MELLFAQYLVGLVTLAGEQNRASLIGKRYRRSDRFLSVFDTDGLCPAFIVQPRADFLYDIKNNQEVIAEIKTTLATIGAKVDSLDIDALSSITVTESPEYIGAITDAEGKIIAGIG